MTETKFPKDWDEARVRRVLEHSESQSEEEAIAEDEAAFDDETHATMVVPKELVPEIQKLIARHHRQ